MENEEKIVKGISEDEDLVLSSSSEDQIDIPLKKMKSSQVFIFLICNVL